MAKVQGTASAWDAKTNTTLWTQRATGMVEIGDNSSTLPITSTNIDVYANNMRVGFIQSMSPSESRTIVKVQELGTEGVVQSVPGNTNGGTISISRFAIYNGNLYNALGLTTTGKWADVNSQIYNKATAYSSETNTLGNPFKTLKEQRTPIEIQTKTKLPDGSALKYYVETYIDCWLSQYSKTIATNQVTITESCQISYSDVFSSIANSD